MFFQVLDKIRERGLLGRCTSLKVEGVEATFAQAAELPDTDIRVEELERRLEEERKIGKAGSAKEDEEELIYGSS